MSRAMKISVLLLILLTSSIIILFSSLREKPSDRDEGVSIGDSSNAGKIDECEVWNLLITAFRGIGSDSILIACGVRESEYTYSLIGGVPERKVIGKIQYLGYEKEGSNYLLRYTWEMNFTEYEKPLFYTEVKMNLKLDENMRLIFSNSTVRVDNSKSFSTIKYVGDWEAKGKECYRYDLLTRMQSDRRELRVISCIDKKRGTCVEKRILSEKGGYIKVSCRNRWPCSFDEITKKEERDGITSWYCQGEKILEYTERNVHGMPIGIKVFLKLVDINKTVEYDLKLR